MSSCQASPWSSTETFRKLPTPSCSPARELGGSSQVGGGGKALGVGEGSRPGRKTGRDERFPWAPASSTEPRSPAGLLSALCTQTPTGLAQAEFSKQTLGRRKPS